MSREKLLYGRRVTGGEVESFMRFMMIWKQYLVFGVRKEWQDPLLTWVRYHITVITQQYDTGYMTCSNS